VPRCQAATRSRALQCTGEPRSAHVVARMPPERRIHGGKQYQPGKTYRSAYPKGYVITPFGYLHPCCVQAIASGETARGRASCSYLFTTPMGRPGRQHRRQPPHPRSTAGSRSFSAIHKTNIVPLLRRTMTDRHCSSSPASKTSKIPTPTFSNRCWATTEGRGQSPSGTAA
jgi:hypothetical protein